MSMIYTHVDLVYKLEVVIDEHALEQWQIDVEARFQFCELQVLHSNGQGLQEWQ